MTTEKPDDKSIREPLLVVFPEKHDYVDNDVQGRTPDPVCEVTSELRNNLSHQVDDVSQIFAPSFNALPDLPAVARVKLRDEAHTKSHRPYNLFNEKTCPVIGAEKAGELLVSVTPSGLSKLRSQIFNTSLLSTAHVSTVEAITPFKATELEAEIPEKGKKHKVGIQLFRHQYDYQNKKIQAEFLARAAKHKIAPTITEYTDKLTIYTIENPTAAAIKDLGSFVGTQSIELVPEYELVRTEATLVRGFEATDLPPPATNKSYGLVGLIDSGTDPENAALQAWVVARDEVDVPRADQNNSHGSFVAGLLINSRSLNHGNDWFPSAQSKIVDVVAFPKGNKVHEDDLLKAIDRALQKFPQVKVWNLSFAHIEQYRHCYQISNLGAALDERSHKHKVLFILPTGNIRQKPLRTYPPQPEIGKTDMMRPPGDSIRSLTVGGIAHDQKASSLVKTGQVSPFSMRGPGVGATLKPEVCHIAGNTDASGKFPQMGVLSIGSNGAITEDVGVSFAVPCVSTIAGNLFEELAAENSITSQTFVKGLIVHSAYLANAPLCPEARDYVGAGKPTDVPDILSCKQSSATVVMKIPIGLNKSYTKQPFPMPSCIVDAKKRLRCEILMTLIYDPPLDKSFGVEYCRTDITASLGTLKFNPEEGKEYHNCQVPPAPAGLAKRYEAGLVKLGLAWSPLKFYYRKFARFGAEDRNWRLVLDRMNRAEYTSHDPQDAYLYLTIRTLKDDPQQPIYEELVRQMSEHQWSFRGMETRSRSRVRASR